VWLLLGLALLPFILTAPGLRAYNTAEVWSWLRPQGLYDKPGTADGEHKFQRDLFRPFQEVVFPIEYKLFGTNALVPRAIQFAVYSAVCLLVFLILQALSKNFLAAYSGALLYAVMPCHVEPVFLLSHMWLNAGFFSFLAFWLVGPSYDRKASWLKVTFASLSYLAGVLCYPSTLLIPVFLLAYELLWGMKEGLPEVKKRLLKAHLPLWLISIGFLAVQFHQLRNLDSLYMAQAKGLTMLLVAKSFLPFLYGMVVPFQLSPLLGLGVLFLLYLGFKRDWRFTLFLLLWAIIGPAFSYIAPALVLSHRFVIGSFGAAGLIGYLLSTCLGGVLSIQRRPRTRHPLIAFLDWTAVISVCYWVLEVFRLSWAGFFQQEGLTYHLRFYAAPIALGAVALRCVLSRSLVPELRKAPLRFLSAGLLALFFIWYIAAFSHLLTFFIDEADDIERIPKALKTAKPAVPDDSLILIVFNDNVPLGEERRLFLYFSGPIWSEYGNRAQSLPFKMWVDAYQHHTIAPDNPIVAFRFDGQKAVQDPQLSARILDRQRSYLGLSSDVIRAKAAATAPTTSGLLLAPNVDSMLIDSAQLSITRPVDEATVRLELLSEGHPTVLEVPADVDGTAVTVRLDRHPPWLLAGKLGQLRVTVRATSRSIPIREASLIQTAGLIDTAPLRLPEPGPCPDTIVHIQTGIQFPAQDYRQIIALP